MAAAVREMVVEGRWRLRVLERSARFFDVRQLLLRYKARVLSYFEYRTPAVYHATDTVLEPLDKLQQNFLDRVGVSQVEALVEFRLAPLSCRRDMAMLGVLHRAALKEGPEHFFSFFYPSEADARRNTRWESRRHKFPLVEYRQGRFLEVLRRSALGLVSVYNRLPAEIVAAKTVKEFQRQLQDLLTARAMAGKQDWTDTFSPRVPLWRHPLN